MIKRERLPLGDEHLNCLAQSMATYARGPSSRRALDQTIADLVKLLVAKGQANIERKQYGDALSFFEAALHLDPDHADAQLGCNRVYRKFIPRWHFEMLNDEERNSAFERALSKAITGESIVLDIGSGSGLLAMMAARAGAKQTVSCEMIPSVAELARHTVALNRHEHRVVILDKKSTDIRIGSDMASKANLLVTETVDCGLLGEGIVPSIAHARENLLTDDAQIIPRSASVIAILVESKRLQNLNYAKTAAGFDVSPINRYATASYFPTRSAAFDYLPLTEPFEVFRFDFTREITASSKEVSIPAIRDGVCHAILFWFSMQLDNEITISNHPGSTTHWEQALQCLQGQLFVQGGKSIKLLSQHDCSMITFKPLGPTS